MATDLFSLHGRIALITGGSRGIGRMIAAGYVARGAKVYISSRKAGACDATAAEVSAGGGT
jgi:NAD(P)-dependent dehydrogenase (short-subunit alcohol dehydrogenase family)